tara:strand:+ start:733 stop:924 length:192 start_codon:yes stop_codon:yes gene_type:complete
MNSRIIIIAILIFIKVIGIASRARAENYLPNHNLYSCLSNMAKEEIQWIKKTYRCGQNQFWIN